MGKEKVDPKFPGEIKPGDPEPRTRLSNREILELIAVKLGVNLDVE